MGKKRKIIISLVLCAILIFGSVVAVTAGTLLNNNNASGASIKVHYYCAEGQPNIYYWNSLPKNISTEWPGVKMNSEKDNWYVYEFNDKTKINMIFNINGNQTADLTRNSGEWWYKNGKWTDKNPDDNNNNDYKRSGDFRDETIYFVMTTRFYDGDTGNNVYCWRDQELGNVANNDPGWRGDFKGLIDKLDYIKALGFSAIWVTPVVQGASDLDYHGYHSNNFSKVDSRYESDGATYQDLIDAIHAKGMKVIQDIVLNHTSNMGEENLYPLLVKDNSADLSNSDCFKVSDPQHKLPSNYATMTPKQQYEQGRLPALKTDEKDTDRIYHHEQSCEWEQYSVETGAMAGDCVDLNTENPTVSKYLRDSYINYINMGVDSFRIDTVKHISRLTFNNEFLPAFKQAGGDSFFMFGECCARYRQIWNHDMPCISTPFYTWKEEKTYPWGDTATNEKSTAQHWDDNDTVDNEPESTNAFLNGNDYHKPDRSKSSGLDMIDFPMHWSFNSARDAFGVALSGDKNYNDATYNVTYVDSHDYAPDCAPENERFNGSQATWAENLNLMFTFRGIPCIYYGSEIEFQKGAPIDPMVNNAKLPYAKSGRAYFGDKIEGSVNVTDFAQYSGATGAMAETLNHPLSKHIQRLNLIRRAIPALRKGQYSVQGVSGDMAFKRRYTNASEGVDSFVCVSVSGGATFTGIPSGTYVDAITGDTKQVNGSLTIPATGQGDMRVYVLQNSQTKTGKIGVDGAYLK